MAMGVNPVFLKAKDIPDASNRPANVLEICLAAEESAGRGSIVGAQLIHGLWRVYPGNKEARTSLLIKGMIVRKTVLQVANTNPFIFRGETGEEKPTTKVWIDNVPISVAEAEFEHSLATIGCELRSAIKTERARDADGKLTRFVTGRRFAFITVPPTPLEKTLKVSVFTAKVYHKEQKLNKRPVVCSRCLEQGHHASQCERDVVCRACKMSGHKKGDPACQILDTVGAVVSANPGEVVSASPSEGVPASYSAVVSAIPPEPSSAIPFAVVSVCASAQQVSKDLAETTKAVGTVHDSRDSSAVKEGRGRPLRQATLTTGSTPLRTRSETPKRRRSQDAASPTEVKEKAKQARKASHKTSIPADIVTESAGVWG